MVVEFERLADDRQVQPSFCCGENERADGAHRAAFSRRSETDEDRAEHEEDQHQRRDQRDDDADCQLNAVDGAELFRQGWRRLREEHRHPDHVSEIEPGKHQAGDDRALVHVADGAPELVGHDDQDEARRDDLRERAGGSDDTGCEPPVVAVAQHDRERDQPHRDDRGGDDAGRRGEKGADHHHRQSEAAAHGAEELSDRVEQVFRHPGAFQNETHEREERDREQRLVAHDAVDAIRQSLKEGRLEQTELDADDAPRKPVEGE